jgi:hypothetical protein
MKRALRGRVAGTAVVLAAVAMPLVCTPTAAFAADRTAANASRATHQAHHVNRRATRDSSSAELNELQCSPHLNCNDSSWGG